MDNVIPLPEVKSLLSDKEKQFLNQLHFLETINSPYLPVIRKLLAIADSNGHPKAEQRFDNLVTQLELSLLRANLQEQKEPTVHFVMQRLLLGMEKESPTDLASIITSYSHLLQEIISSLHQAQNLQDWEQLNASISYLKSLDKILTLIMSSTVVIMTPIKSSKILSNQNID